MVGNRRSNGAFVPSAGEYIKACLSMFIAISLFSSCSDSSPAGNPDPLDPQDNTYPLTLNFPYPGFGSTYSYTRAEDDNLIYDPIDIDRDEGLLDDLYLVVFKEDEDFAGKYNFMKCEDIKNYSTIQSSLSSSYNNDYILRLERGKYRIYLLANIYQYWKNGQPSSADKTVYETVLASEKGIREINLKFNEAGYIEARSLPMICLPEEVTTDERGTNKLTGGIFEITDEEIKNFQDDKTKRKTLYAPMNILCSKVRYTVLFDNTDDTDDSFSREFFSSNIHFTPMVNGKGSLSGPVTFSNIYRITPVIPLTANATTEETNWITLITKYIYQVNYPEKRDQSSLNNGAGGDPGTGDEPGLGEEPEPGVGTGEENSSSNRGSDTYGYFDIKNADHAPAYLQPFITGREDSWNPASQRAWQGGAVYLPENNKYTASENELKQTVLHLDAYGPGVNNQGYNIPIWLNRGYFYDIVAKVISADVVAFDVSIRVNAWSYNQVTVGW